MSQSKKETIKKEKIALIDIIQTKEALKGINPKKAYPLNDLEAEMDKATVQHYLQHRKGKRKKEDKESLGIKGGIPSFEICLRRCCENIGLCYDIKTQKLKEIKSCERLIQTYTIKYAKGKYISEISHREIAYTILALRELMKDKELVALAKDVRLDYLLSKFEEIANHTTDKATIKV